ERRPVHGLDHLGDGEGLARAGDAEQDLLAVAAPEAKDEVSDRGRLVALGLEGRDDAEVGHGWGDSPPRTGLPRADILTSAGGRFILSRREPKPLPAPGGPAPRRRPRGR